MTEAFVPDISQAAFARLSKNDPEYRIDDNTFNIRPIKRSGYSTLRGFYKMLKAQNKNCKRMGTRVKFEIQLPI